jgi:glycosyltransferase involved in cell wall biosynthesis
MNLRDISVIITTYNEEKNVSRCLEGLSGFGEIVMVDAFSTDRTVEIARGYSVTIYRRPYESAAKQKNWALDRARHAWVLILDADEALSIALKREIESLEDERNMEGYWIRRRSEYLGRPIRYCGWQRDKVLRFFRRERGRYDDRQVHEEIALHGKSGFLAGRLLHFPYPALDQHIEKINEYSGRGANDYHRRGGRMALVNMILHPPFRFLRMYIMQRGFLDGRMGFVLSLISSYGVFLKYAKALELERWRKEE